MSPPTEPTLIAIALVWHAGKLAVGRRGGSGPLAGFDEWPGGHVEPGETPAEAAARECLEETGLAVRIQRHRRTLLYRYEHKTVELHFFDGDLLDEAAAASIQHPFAWWSMEEVLAGKFPPANQAILDELAEEHGESAG